MKNEKYKIITKWENTLSILKLTKNKLFNMEILTSLKFGRDRVVCA